MKLRLQMKNYKIELVQAYHPDFQDQENSMGLYRFCRFRRKTLLVTMLVCGMFCFTLYTICLTCCVLAGPFKRASRGTETRNLNVNLHITGSDDYRDYLDPDPGRLRADLAQRKYRAHIGYRSNNRQRQDQQMDYNADVVRHRKPQDLDEYSNNYIVDEEESESDNSHHEYDAEMMAGRFADHVPLKNSGIVKVQQHGASKKLPTALIIGVKKGGTRALLEFLRVHPDIRAPGPEPHFFDRHYDKGIEWYRQQMPSTIEGQITMEKTPSYFVTKEVPRRIYNMSKDMKLIVVLRDPVTRAISDYTQTKSKRHDIKPFENMAFLNNTSGVVDTSWGAIKIGVYAKHLERWLKYFPLKQMHFVSGEKLISDPALVMARVQDFLGIKRVVTDKHFYFNSTKGFPCLKKPEGSGSPHCLGKTKGRSHPTIHRKVLQRLRDFYRPFNAKFYQMVGQDFGWP